jgi:hypothetical protein
MCSDKCEGIGKIKESKKEYFSFFSKNFFKLFIYSHVHTLGHFSPLMPLLPSPPFPPSVPGSTCSALISNFVEEKT